jgi:hypothetical protein
MKRSQITLFALIGIAILFITGFFMFSAITRSSESRLAESTRLMAAASQSSIKASVEDCISESVKAAVLENGLRDETSAELEAMIASGIEECMSAMLERLEDEGMEISAGSVMIETELNPETLLLDIAYPLTIKDESKSIDFDGFHFSFDRSNTVRIDEGRADREIILRSQDDNAMLTIPEGVEVRDDQGNLIETIGIRVDDLHFDGLSNGVVLGQTVYENFPDGAIFSDAIEISIRFDQEDIPSGYAQENIRIAYWDGEDGVWYAPPTSIKDDVATANITHFSRYALTLGKPSLSQAVVFKERFQPISGSPTANNEGIWVIGGADGSAEGTATLQPAFTTIADVMAEYGSPDNPTDYRIDMQSRYDHFIAFPALQYGYFKDPSNADDADFIDCEHYTPGNIGDYQYYLEDGYPVFVSQEEENSGEVVSGWHNQQCAGGRLRRAPEEAAADFLVFQPDGNSVIGILSGILPIEPAIYAYSYPMEDTFCIDYDMEHYKMYMDGTYPFYCETVPFPSGKTVEKISLSSSSLDKVKERGLDTEKRFVTYGINGINSIKRTEHPLSRNEMHAQCEIFIFMWGDGAAYRNIPENNLYQGLDIQIPAEMIGAAVLRQPW